jgi:dephospho-CoA kinase
LGVIGPIAAGKSTVLAALAQLGAATLQADEASRALMQPGNPALAAVVEAFGAGCLSPDGTLDRAALGQIVFADEAARERLERLTHPAMVEWLRDRIAQIGNTAPRPVVVALEAAVLDRMGARPLCDRVLLVTAPHGVRRSRLVAKGLGDQQADARLRAQSSMGLEGPADYVIDTTGPEAQTRAKVVALWPRIRRDMHS